MANEANIIKIKRSGTSGAPASLKLGELAYSYLAASGNPTSNGGDRLFIGANGVNGAGNANDVVVIGGKYFTDLLDHTRGELTASSALIVDSNKKLDELLVDDLSLNGNTVSSAAGYLTLNAFNNIVQLAAGNYIAGGANDGSQVTLTDAAASLQQVRDGVVSLSVGTAGSATSTVTLNNNGTLTVPGTINTLSNGNLTLSPNGTGLVSIKGNWTLPNAVTSTTGYVLTANTDGTTSWAASASAFTFTADTLPGSDTSETLNLLTDTLYLSGDAGAISTSVTVSGTINKTYTTTIAARLASTSSTGVASFSSDSFSVDGSGVVTVKSSGISNSQLTNSTIYIGTTQVTLGDASGTTTSLAVDISGNAATATNVDYAGLTGTVPTWNQDTTGNAGSVTNGVYTTGSYANPSWLTAVDYSILNGTVPTWNQDTTGKAATAGNADTVTNGVYTTGSYANPSWLTAVDYSILSGTVPTWNQDTTGQAGKVANALTNGSNIQTFSFDGSSTATVALASDLTDIDSISSSAGTGAVTLNASGGHSYVFDTDGTVTFNSAYTFPAAKASTAGYVLTDVTGNGVLSWAAAGSSLSIASDIGTGTIDLLSETFTISGGEGIDTDISGNTLTISAEVATSSNKGVASFSTDSFTVTSGDVTIKSAGVSNSQLANSTIYIGTTQVTLGDASGTTTSLAVDISGKATTAGNADTVTNGVYTTDTGTVTNTMLAGSIDNSKLSNSTISGVSLGNDLYDLTEGANIQTFTYNGGSVGVVALATTLTNLTEVNVGDLKLSGSTIENSTSATGDVVLVANNGGGDKSFTFGGDGNLSVAGRITNLSTPTDATDAATKAYVDATRTGLDVKASVRAATTGNITLSNTQTIDGVALSVDDRVLVKNQSTASQNGIYVVASGAWTRAADADNTPAGEVTGGMFTFIEEGNTYADSGWVLSTDGAITLGTTDLVFVQFSGAGQLVAGAGLTKTGNTLDVTVANGIEIANDNVQLASSVAGDGLTYTNGVLDVAGTTDRISVAANAVDIASTYVGQTSITTLGTVTTGTWNGTAVDSEYGGTGFTTYAKGDFLYASAANTLSKLAAGTNGQTLQLQDGVPYWGDLDGGTY